MAAGALWGFVFLAPQVLHGFRSSQLSAARYLIYGLFALLLLFPKRKSIPQIGRSGWFALIWLGLAGNIVYYVLLGRAVQLAGGAASSLIIGLLPVVVTLWGAYEDRSVKIATLLFPLLLCCLGVSLIGYQSLHAANAAATSHQRSLGLLCAFGALFSWAAFAVGNSRYLRRLTDISAHDWSLLTGVVTGSIALALSCFVLLRQPETHSSSEWLRFWAVSTAVAVFASILGNKFWNQASRLLPLTLTGQMIIFETLFALLYSFLWEHRPPTLLEFLAMGSLISGVLWCASLHRSAPGAAAELVDETP